MIMVMAVPMGMGVIMVVAVIMGMGVVMVVVVIMGMIMIVIVVMTVALWLMGLFTGYRFSGPGDFYRAGSLSASAGVTHGYSFCSTNKDLICNSVPRTNRMPG